MYACMLCMDVWMHVRTYVRMYVCICVCMCVDRCTVIICNYCICWVYPTDLSGRLCYTAIWII